VFRRHGFRRSSIEQAAEEAGLTRQALYHHFPSKEALFRAGIERLYEKALVAEAAAARAAAEDADASLADILIAEIGARLGTLFAALEGSPHLDELFSEHLAQARDLYQTYSARFEAEIAATIARVCRARKLKLASGIPVEGLARCVEMAIHGTKSAYPSMQPLDAFQNQLAVMLRMLIAGAMVPQTTPRARKS
jgi:AcrR family transcriptional regulator